MKTRHPLELWPFVCLLAALVSMTATVWLCGRTLLPTTPSLSTAGRTPHPYGYSGHLPNNSIQADVGGANNVSLAADAYTVRCLRLGTLPFWEPFQALGQPLLANSLSAVLYPINWLHSVLAPRYWDLVYLVNWYLAAAFFYLFMRRTGIETPYALFSAVTLFASGWYQCWLTSREVMASAAWFPFLLYAIERVIQEPERWLGVVLVALGVALSIFGGHPEVFAVGLSVASLYALTRLFFDREPARARTATWLVVGALAGLLLSAPQWLNFWDAHLYSFNGHGTGVAWAGRSSLPLTSLVEFLFPYVFGIMHEYPFGETEPGWHWSSSPGWIAGGLIGFLAFASLTRGARRVRDTRFYFFLGTLLLTGAKIWGLPWLRWIGGLPVFNEVIWPRYAAFLLPLSLAYMGARTLSHLAKSDPREWKAPLRWWAGFSFLAASIAYSEVNFRFPGTLPGVERETMALLLLGFAWEVAAPLGTWLVYRRAKTWSGSAWITSLASVLFPSMAYYPLGLHAADHIFLSAIYLVGFALLVLLPRWEAKPFFWSTKLTAALALAILVGPVTLYCGIKDVGLPDRHDPLLEPPYLDYLRAHEQGGRYRSLSLDALPMPNFASAFFVSNYAWILPLIPKETVPFTAHYIDRGFTEHSWFGGNIGLGRNLAIRPEDELSHNLRYLSLIGIRYIIAEKTRRIAAVFRPVYDDPQTSARVYENARAIPRMFLAPCAKTLSSPTSALDSLGEIQEPTREVVVDTARPVRCLSFRGETLRIPKFELEPNVVSATVVAETAGILTLTDLYAPGWTALVNGAPAEILRVDGIFRGLRIDEPGRYEVRFSYLPPRWYLSLRLAVLGLLVCALPFIFSLFTIRVRKLSPIPA